MIRWIKSLFCSHAWEWVRNIYGDEIIDKGYSRSIWKCTKCGAVQWREELHEEARL